MLGVLGCDHLVRLGNVVLEFKMSSVGMGFTIQAVLGFDGLGAWDLIFVSVLKN